jgi:hypothetical protein
MTTNQEPKYHDHHAGVLDYKTTCGLHNTGSHFWCTRTKGHKGMHESYNVTDDIFYIRWEVLSRKKRLEKVKKRMYLTDEDVEIFPRKRVSA